MTQIIPGTTQLSKNNGAVAEPRMPSLSNFVPVLNPGKFYIPDQIRMIAPISRNSRDEMTELDSDTSVEMVNLTWDAPTKPHPWLRTGSY